MIFGLFDDHDDTADKIIDYLESEKYEWVNRKLTPVQRKEAEKYALEASKLIDDNPFFRKGQKRKLKFDVKRSFFQEQKEKPRLVKIVK